MKSTASSPDLKEPHHWAFPGMPARAEEASLNDLQLRFSPLNFGRFDSSATTGSEASDLSLINTYTLTCSAPVAQLDRVTGFEPVGREFESLRACQIL